MRRLQNIAPVIPNDRLEHDRIMLETNLRHSETAIHLSSATESEAEDNLESLEYPRHNPGPASFNELPSLDYRIRDHLADEDTPDRAGHIAQATTMTKESIHMAASLFQLWLIMLVLLPSVLVLVAVALVATRA